MAEPYWSGDGVQLYLGDCREIDAWLAADVLVTDPPYGRAWKSGELNGHGGKHEGIAGDDCTDTRDAALSLWGDRLAMVFGDLMLPPPANTRIVLPFVKAAAAGNRGAVAGFRRDAEAIYLIGSWPYAFGGRTSLVRSGTRVHSSLSIRYGHPHAKPVDVMETLIAACPPGVIADPFAGSGSTLVAARNLGRRAIGVELEERYAERAAQRLSQGALEVL